MKKNEIIDILKTIQYPGFSRDIVSFGMLKNITFEDKLNCRINTEEKNNKK